MWMSWGGCILVRLSESEVRVDGRVTSVLKISYTDLDDLDCELRHVCRLDKVLD